MDWHNNKTLENSIVQLNIMKAKYPNLSGDLLFNPDIFNINLNIWKLHAGFIHDGKPCETI